MAGGGSSRLMLVATQRFERWADPRDQPVRRTFIKQVTALALSHLP
jgi:hypothetical protein